MSRKPRSHVGNSIPATELFDFEEHDKYNKKYHSEHRWVFAGEKYSNGTVSGNFYFTTVTVKTETGEICDISVEAQPEGNLPGVGDYYRIVSTKNKSFCSESSLECFEAEGIESIKYQLEERARILEKGIFYAFDLEKSGKNEHLFFEHQEDWNRVNLLEGFKSKRNNKFY